MTQITIQLSSPPAGTKSVREIIRIKTPEKMFSLGDEVLDENLNMTEPSFEDKRAQVVDTSSQDLPTLDAFHSSVEEQYVYTTGDTGGEDFEHLSSHVNKETGNDRDSTGFGNEGGEMVVRPSEPSLNFQVNSYLQRQCESCGRPEDKDEFESELYITRKDLATVQSQLETFKSRLEEELVERFKLEQELKSEAESHEIEMKVLTEKIESLTENESEKAKRVEELENTTLIYKEEYEKCLGDVEELKKCLRKYHNEVCKLRAEANMANDQAVEAINEMEILTKKTEKSEHEKDKIRKELTSEMEGYWKEVRELRAALENWEKLDAEKTNRILTLENEVSSYKDLVNELREELPGYSNKTNESESKVNQNKSEHLLMLYQELHEIFREHLNSQGKFSELSFVLTATQKELEEARNRGQMQNLALQGFKQKYNDLHDNMVALSEENRHLRNSLEKKYADFRDIRRKFLVSETEVSWLKEALNIVDNARKKSVCSEVMETMS